MPLGARSCPFRFLVPQEITITGRWDKGDTTQYVSTITINLVRKQSQHILQRFIYLTVDTTEKLNTNGSLEGCLQDQFMGYYQLSQTDM